MAEIGRGYGSEWHLLRYLGYHRNMLNTEIEKQVKLSNIDWKDFPFSSENQSLKRDSEFKGINFLDNEKHKLVFEEWKKYWPQTGNPPNWDAIGVSNENGTETFLLVEAKAHFEECMNDCKASEGSRKIIISAFRKVMPTVQKAVSEPEDWLRKYYQYANRIAMLYFLRENNISAKLLFIYFTGDTFPGKKCPQTADQWNKKIEKIHNHLKIDDDADLMKHVKHVILPVIDMK